MPTPSARRKGGSQRPTPSLTWLLMKDALLMWGVPVVLAGGIGLFALLALVEGVSPQKGILGIGWFLLLFVFFFPLRVAMAGEKKRQERGALLLFATFWVGITFLHLYFTVFVGEETFVGTLLPDSPDLFLPLKDKGAVYDFVIEGSFPPASGQVERKAGYQLILEKDGHTVQKLAGTFSEQWTRRRLGRRGSTTTHLQHTRFLHQLVSRSEGNYHLKLVYLDPQLAPSLKVSLYRDEYPEKTFWVLSALLLFAAYALETRRREKEVPFVPVTASALTFLYVFRHLGPPPHGYQNLVGAGMVAAILGPLGGGAFRYGANLGVKAIRPFLRPQSKGTKARS